MQVLTTWHQHDVWITWDSVANRNALTTHLLVALQDAIAEAAMQEPKRLILRGAGPDTGVGADVKELARCTRDEGEAFAYCTRIMQIMRAIARLPCPTVALMQGTCVGGTILLLLAADYRLLEKNAKLHFPFARLGIAPDAYSDARFRALMKPSDVTKVLESTRSFKAADALAMGLVDGLLEPGAVEQGDNGMFSTPPSKPAGSKECYVQRPTEAVIPMIRSIVSPKVRDNVAALLSAAAPSR